jgi:hypothetical protein
VPPASFSFHWPSGIGPRVAEPALLKIDPYPWSAPYEDVSLKKSVSSARGSMRAL